MDDPRHWGYTTHARAVAAYGLPGTALAFGDEPLGPVEWQPLIATVCSQRITGLLTQAIAEESLPVTDQQWDEAIAAHLGASTICLRLERLLIHVIRILDSAGIDHRVLKGPALAAVLYPDPSLRTFGDIDVLVQSADYDTTVRLLCEQGYRRQHFEPRPGYDRRFAKGTTFDTPEGLEIDLHRTLANGPYGLRIDLADLWERFEAFEIGGVRMKALDLYDRVVHHCYHAVLGDPPPRIQPLRDIAQAVLTCHLDIDRLRALARHWGGEAVLARSISLTWDVLALDPEVDLASWADNYTFKRGDRKALEAYHRGWLFQARAAFWAVPGPARKAAYARALVFPDRQFLAGRHQSLRSRWHLALGEVRPHRLSPPPASSPPEALNEDTAPPAVARARGEVG